MKYLIAMLFLAACGARTEPVKQDDKVVVPKVPVVTSVTFKRYAVSETEHVLLIDVPDKYVARRCMIYANSETKTSNISCNFDEVGAMPEQE